VFFLNTVYIILFWYAMLAEYPTRSQAVAGIADRTASQHTIQ